MGKLLVNQAGKWNVYVNGKEKKKGIRLMRCFLSKSVDWMEGEGVWWRNQISRGLNVRLKIVCVCFQCVSAVAFWLIHAGWFWTCVDNRPGMMSPTGTDTFFQSCGSLNVILTPLKSFFWHFYKQLYRDAADVRYLSDALQVKQFRVKFIFIAHFSSWKCFTWSEQ